MTPKKTTPKRTRSAKIAPRGKRTKEIQAISAALARATNVANLDANEYISKADAIATLGTYQKALERMVNEAKVEKFIRRGSRKVYYRRSAIDALGAQLRGFTPKVDGSPSSSSAAA